MNATTPSPITSTEHSRSNRRRGGRVATLPKMTASERGKYYRKKHKEHQRGLEHSVVTLRQQVHDLEQFLRLRQDLASHLPCDWCDSIVRTVFEFFARMRHSGFLFESSFRTTTESATPFDCVRNPRLPSTSCHWGNTAEREHSADPSMDFCLLSLGVEGCADAAVVVAHGQIKIDYTTTAIERMFPHVFHDHELLVKLVNQKVRYPCTYQFRFGSGGKLESRLVEADYVYGLQQVVGSLHDVEWLLRDSQWYRPRQDTSTVQHGG